jgi:hypothetical protein
VHTSSRMRRGALRDAAALPERCQMSERSRSIYDDMPFSQVLFRYLWPFWLFRNAATGDRYARAAAYRHNRMMRVHLPGYLMKWMCSSVLALVLTLMLDSLSTHSLARPDVFTLMAAAAGVVFACGVTVLFVTGYIYLYLARNEH